MHIYLDHNIVDDISKGKMSLNPSDKIIWVYSIENLNEINRSGDSRFLDVYADIKARKIDLVLDEKFRMTGGAIIQKYQNPHDVYESHIDAINNPDVDETSNIEFLARLFGGDNREQILSLPDDFEDQIRSLLEPIDMHNEQMKEKVEIVSNDLRSLVNNELQEIEEIEISREGIGTHKGRVGILAEYDNPIDEIWRKLKGQMPGITADQFFGFDPIDKQGYQDWPLFLGIVGCHTILNFIGFRPDKGLSKTKELPGILTDGRHIAYGAYCQGILSRDKKFNAKAKAIYRYKNIGTQVLTVEYKKMANKANSLGLHIPLRSLCSR